MLETIIALIAKNGISVVCLAVILWDHIKFQEKLEKILDAMSKRLTKIETKLEIEEDE